MKTRYKIIPVAIISTMAIGGVAYLINESKKITLVTKEDTTMEEFADKLDIDIKDLKKWNKDLDDTLLEGQEVTIKTDLDNADNYQVYTIQVGDTKESISEEFGLSEDALIRMDRALRSDKTIAGNYGKEVEIFSLNSTTTKTVDYIIEKGENLSSIARYLGTSIDAIKNENNLTSDAIVAGDILNITLELTDAKYEEIMNRNSSLAYQLYLELMGEDTSKYTVEETSEEKEEKSVYSGIDVSEHQGKIDWKKVKNDNVDYAIIRMYDAYNMSYQKDGDTLEGKLSKLDEHFLRNINGCEKNNIPYGIYIYSRAVTEEQARIEAYKFLKFAKEYNINPTWPIYYDIEPIKGEPLYDEDGKKVSSQEFFKDNPEQIVKNFKAWASVLEEHGYYCGIYSNENGLNAIDSTGELSNEYAVWIAKYKYSPESETVNNDELCDITYNGSYGMYQFSQTGTCSGIEGFVDRNYAYVNYAKYISGGSYNNLTQEDEKTKVLR